MSATGGQLRLGLVIAVLLLLLVNVSGLWSDTTAQRVYAVLQACTGIAVLIVGLAVASRLTGVARTWRLLVVATILCQTVGEAIWWFTRGGTGGTAAAPAIAAYFLAALLALVVLALLARIGIGGGHPHGLDRAARAVAAIDGVVAAISFAILAMLAGVGALTGVALPRSGSTTVVAAYSVLELMVVVAAVLIAMLYRPDRPYRTNFMLLAGGAVAIVTSDRLMAYLHTVGVERGDLWSFGLVLGPLLIAYAMLPTKPRPAQDPDRDAMYWAQLLLPYSGFFGTALLFAFHVLIGQQLNPFVVCGAVTMVSLVAVRQVIVMRAQSQLTQRLYDAQQRLAHQVHHDPLTGLPNRLLLSERLDAAIGRGPFVLIFVDLDDFKEVNDRFGHAGGDELLCLVGNRLRRCIGESDTLARIGGDEFAILIDGSHDPPDVIADRIRVALRDPFAIHGSSIRVRASMGLVRPNPDDPLPTSDDLLRQADVSMYAGKRVGKDTAVIYRPSLGVSTDFPTALRTAKGGIPDGFRLAYQPVVRLPDAVPVALEALARWTAPNGTEIQPDAFVAAAEAAGLGAMLDAMVLNLACREMCSAGINLVLHVNIGGARLGSIAFEQQVRRTLARCGMTPNQLVLEITETVPLLDLADAASQIARLNAIGVKVALDDFGAGYSSLTYLHSLPVQMIKLDRGLAVGPEPDRIETLYRSVVRLSDELGVDVIAEGIESAAQASTVYAAGCRLAQGHLFGQAAPIDALASLREVLSAR
ncbi:putative bifunctional diguanylate cyclase/phosphodiesterase [Mycolicibacterium agri]|uniref:GGDEF-domain containing protein n=1 Tax=Mycolicibacterium agri TaxID=36811 RepID=A0A7I9VY88_MYCAG|nr:EAL domain-containing protein [Mycolicibacterium agri]GFG50411.1 GGDEF-domain containing protein [Mycolicibacterium agri]